MLPTQKFVTATEARKRFFEILDIVKKTSIPYNITIKGIPEVVLMNREHFEGWIATFETMANPKLVEAIRRGEEDIKRGRYATLEEVFTPEGKLRIRKSSHVSRSPLRRSTKRSSKA